MEKITYHHQVWRKGFQNAKEGFEISGKYSHGHKFKVPRFDDDTDDIVEEKDILNDDEMTKFIVKCQEPSSPITADVITAICLLC